ncbi:MAG: GNAT family N-acetyltransferase [Actinocrinis sp.]
MDVVVREARESELDEVGAVTVEVYGDGLVHPDYLEVLRDTRSRFESPATTTLVALDDGTDGLLGAVLHAAPGSPWRNLGVDEEHEIRILAVLESARGRGVGENLVRACIARAKAAGGPRLVLCTQSDMAAAQRLYARMGFQRTPERDWAPRPGLSLLSYAMELPA